MERKTRELLRQSLIQIGVSQPTNLGLDDFAKDPTGRWRPGTIIVPQHRSNHLPERGADPRPFLDLPRLVHIHGRAH